MKSLGFTLVEVVVSLCLLALVTSGSMLLLAGPLRRASRATTLQDFSRIERWAREHSQEVDSRLQLDLSRQRIGFVNNLGPAIELPSHYRLTMVILKGAVSDAGLISIGYRRGSSETYAILFSPTAGEGQWAVICGPSGQVEIYNESEISKEKLVSWLAEWAHPD